MAEGPIFTQQRNDFNAKMSALQQARTKAKRMIDELDWRLHVSGAPDAISMEEVSQAVHDLQEAWSEIQRLNGELQSVPPEFYRQGGGV